MDVSDDERRRPIGAVVRMDDDIEPTSARANSRGDGGANATRATRFLSIENLPGKTRPTHAREMCGDFGVVKRAVVDVGALKPGTSEMKILVEFEDAEACARARDALDGANVEGLTARCDFARGLSAGGGASILERLELPRGGRDSGARGHHHQGSSRGYGREMHRDANDVGPGAHEDERRFGRKRARSMSPPRRDHRRSSRDRSPPSRDKPQFGGTKHGQSTERRRRSTSPRRGGRRRSPSPPRYGRARRSRSRSFSRSRSRSRDREYRRRSNHHRSRSNDRRRRGHDRRDDKDKDKDDDRNRGHRRAKDDEPRRRRRDRSLSLPSRSSSEDDRSRSPPRRRRRREYSRSRSR